MNKLRKAPAKAATSTLRIIGGVHRGRKLPIPALDGLRPTADRIRETLFNWLQFDIPGMTVLDLFAGTGALGLEALSREAKHAVMVEPQGAAARALMQSLSTLKLENGQVKQMTAQQYLQSANESFDLVFVDPPFDLDLWQETLAMLVSDGHLHSGSYVYVESPKQANFPIPAELQTIKDKSGGKVRFRLLQMT